MTVHKEFLSELVSSIKDLEKEIISLLENAEQKNKISPNIVLETDVYKKQLKENMYMLYETKNILWAERYKKNKYGYYKKITILVSEKKVKKYLYDFIDLRTKLNIMYEDLKYISKLKGFWSNDYRGYTENHMLCELVAYCGNSFENIKETALNGYNESDYICNKELEKNKNLMTMYLNQNRRLKGYLFNYYPKVWCYEDFYLDSYRYSIYTDLSDEEIKKYIPEILELRNKFIRLKTSLLKTCVKQDLTKDFPYRCYLI